MSYCLNPDCTRATSNPTGAKLCQACASKLVLRNRYRAITLIGQSGFGRTFLAVDEDKPSKPRCVIKQLFPQAQCTNNANAQKAAELFEQEAVRLDELGKHPHIPELLAYFVEENRQYLVQEFIDGQNLAQILETESAFRETQIRNLLKSLLPVLQFIHTHQVIHRDIKPENIIRRPDGKLFLVDFGAAKYATGTALLRTGTTLGTPEYVAPEQAIGKAIFASDLYSLGVTCIHLLTRMSPFDLSDRGEDTWVWRQYLVNNSVSDELSRILDKLIETATNRRYQAAEEVIKDLNPPQPHQPYVEDYYQQGIDKSKRGNYKEAIEDFNQILFINPNHADAYKCRGLAQSKLGKNQLAIADFQQAADLYLKLGNTVDYLYARDCIRKPQIPTSQRLAQNWRCVQTLTGHSGIFAGVLSVAISPDGLTLASAGEDYTIKLWNLIAGQEVREVRTLYGHSKFVRAVTFSPNGEILASCGDDKIIKLWHSRNGVEIDNLTGHSQEVTTVAISPNGEILASGSDDKTIKLWNLWTGQEICTLSGHSDYIQSVTFSPDGQTLASGSCDKSIKIWNMKTGQEIRTLSRHSRCVKAVTFSRDSQTIISGSEDNKIKVWKLDTGSLRSTLSSPSGGIYGMIAIAISPDGQILASGGRNDKTIKIWHLGTEKLLCTLTGHSKSVSSLVFSHDGQTLFSGSYDKTIKIWRCE